MSHEITKFAYSRIVTLFAYAESEPFGTYDQETRELRIANAQAAGNIDLGLVPLYLQSMQNAGDALGNSITFNVPRKAYELREKAKYARMEEL